jgi:hypothetical protein
LGFPWVSGKNFPIIQFCESPFIVDMLIHYMSTNHMICLAINNHINHPQHIK